MQKDIYLIGLGGIGSQLCEPICRYINYLQNYKDFSITLIDGDFYENGNLTRQNFQKLNIGMNKAETQYNRMKKLFPNLELFYEAIYINSKNINTLISNNSIILSGVDNHKTRKIIQDYVSTLDNILYISGGNNYTDGTVLIYARKNGVQLSPTIYNYHPDIAHPKDRSPEEIGCDELVESEPQLIFTNGTVSMIMQWAFYNYYQLFDRDDIEITKNDIMFDICDMMVVSHKRKIQKVNFHK